MSLGHKHFPLTEKMVVRLEATIIVQGFFGGAKSVTFVKRKTFLSSFPHPPENKTGKKIRLCRKLRDRENQVALHVYVE